MSARVLVTGAASGIGAATVRKLREQGATVLGLDLHAADDIIACDVADPERIPVAVAEAIERLGGLDVLVNNAGIGIPQSAAAAPDAGAEAVIAVNLMGPWRVTAAALPALRASRGRVINIASGLAHMAIPFVPAYCMAKRGLIGFSDSLRHEVGHEVTVTTVYPGYVRTPIHDVSKQSGFGLEGSVPAEPLGLVAARIARACLGRPVRDLATSRAGTVNYLLLRWLPRRVQDRIVQASLRRYARRGTVPEGSMAAPLMLALKER